MVHERFQKWRQMGVFEKLMKKMAEYYARECSGISWKWQAMDSKHSAAPLWEGRKRATTPPTEASQELRVPDKCEGRQRPVG